MNPDIIRDKFESGMNYATFKDKADRNREHYHQLYETLNVPQEDVDAFSQLVQLHGGCLNVLALAEDWCGDAVRAFPLLANLVEAVDGMALRIQQSEATENQALVQNWPKGDRNPIPIIVFLDKDFNEIGHWIERTKAGDAFLNQLREAHKDLEGQAFFKVAGPKMIEAFKTQFWRDTLDEWQAALRVKETQMT